MSQEINPEIVATDDDKPTETEFPSEEPTQDSSQAKTSTDTNEAGVEQAVDSDPKQNQMEDKEEMPKTDVEENSSSKVSFIDYPPNTEESNEEGSRRLSLDLEDLEDIMKSDSQEIPAELLFSEETPSEEKKEVPDPSVSTLLDPSLDSRIPHHPSITTDYLASGAQSPKNIVLSKSEVGSASTSSSSSVEPSVGDDDAKIDRNIYYGLHEMYTSQVQREKFKNNYYQSKLAQYYNRKRMYHVFVERMTAPEHQKRYEKLLEELEEVNDDSARQHSTLEEEVASLKNKFQSRKEQLAANFEKLQKEQLEFSKELINPADEDGKENAQKFVTRFLKRQKTAFATLSKMRLENIKLKNKYNETQEIINSLDNLGSSLRLIDYQQLKTDNRNLRDKLEEKDMALISIRQDCKNAMQLLAHTREKVTAVDLEIERVESQQESVTEEVMEVREQLNSLKSERNYFRKLIAKMIDGSGLLFKPALLKDFERSVNDVSDGQVELEELKEGYSSVNEELHDIRLKLSSVHMFHENETTNSLQESIDS